jgi:hypothetical protein
MDKSTKSWGYLKKMTYVDICIIECNMPLDIK